VYSDREYGLKLLKERIGRMIGKTAIIELGAPSELEMKELKDKFTDALNSVKLAL